MIRKYLIPVRRRRHRLRHRNCNQRQQSQSTRAVRGAERQLAAATADIGVQTAELFPKFR